MRSETVKIRLVMDRAARDSHRDDVALIGNDPHLGNVHMEDGKHTLSIDYTFNVDYYGRCDERLPAMSRLMQDHNIAVSCSLEEVRHGLCIIQQLCDNYRALVTHLEARR